MKEYLVSIRSVSTGEWTEVAGFNYFEEALLYFFKASRWIDDVKDVNDAIRIEYSEGED